MDDEVFFFFFGLLPTFLSFFSKVIFDFVTILLLFYVLVFCQEVCGILVPQPGIELEPPALEREVLVTGPPGKFPSYFSVFY